jgi:chorismate mutase
MAGVAGGAAVAEKGGVADGGEEDPRLETLVHHRGCIDRIDKTIVALLTERVRLGLALGDLKRGLRLPLRSGTREAEVLARVRQAAGGPLSSQSAERIFSAIIAETSAAQEDGRE